MMLLYCVLGDQKAANAFTEVSITSKILFTLYFKFYAHNNV